MRASRALVAALAAVGLAGCGIGGSGNGNNGSGTSSQTNGKTETTRVQVVEDLGKKGGFDASAIYRRLSPGVVTIVSRFGSTVTGGSGLGSGFVVDGQGFIATNAHVVSTGFERSGGKLREARELYVEFGDGNRVPASIVGLDPNADIALVKVDPKGLTLVPLRFAQPNGIEVGDPVAAIGSPFGEEQSLSVGVVSALDRDIQSLNARFAIGHAIQTDAAINHGNSGGPLLDSHGNVIGVNAQIQSSSGGGEGVGFAIPGETVRRSVGELKAKGRVDYGYMGVSTLELFPQLADRLGVPVDHGALVGEVVKGGPAAKAGIKAGDKTIRFQGIPKIPAGGDVIVAVDGKPVKTSSDLAAIVSLKDPGSTVKVELVRDGKKRTVDVRLERRPTDLGTR
jgi:S1-C subfamily serine protease